MTGAMQEPTVSSLGVESVSALSVLSDACYAVRSEPDRSVTSDSHTVGDGHQYHQKDVRGMSGDMGPGDRSTTTSSKSARFVLEGAEMGCDIDYHRSSGFGGAQYPAMAIDVMGTRGDDVTVGTGIDSVMSEGGGLQHLQNVRTTETQAEGGGEADDSDLNGKNRFYVNEVKSRACVSSHVYCIPAIIENDLDLARDVFLVSNDSVVWPEQAMQC